MQTILRGLDPNAVGGSLLLIALLLFGFVASQWNADWAKRAIKRSRRAPKSDAPGETRDRRNSP